MEQETPGRLRPGDPTTEADPCAQSAPGAERRAKARIERSLEAHGFTESQTARILFMKWLYGHGMVQS